MSDQIFTNPQVTNLAQNENVVRKKFLLQFLYSLIVISSVFQAIYWAFDLMLLFMINGIGIIIHVLLLIYFYNFSFTVIKLFANLYLIFISIFITLFVILLWKVESVIFMWYILIPLGVINLFSYKAVIKWGLYVLALAVLVFTIPFDQFYSIKIADQQVLTYFTMFTFTSILYLVCFIIYFKEKISKYNREYALVTEADITNFEEEKKLSNIVSSTDEESNKYNELFAEIKAYLEKNKPFKDPDFSIQQLAAELNSNSTYISRAINMNTNMNFKTFINKYRINQVKQELNDIDSNKYTLMYIYTSAGFKYQSTFNKVFKQIENITPSEYIAQKNKHTGDKVPE